LKRAAAALLCLAGGAARAAGGHYDVDDATILEAGHCQVETWSLSARRPGQQALHLGPACNLGGLEWGLNADRLRADDSRLDSGGVQVKWVADPAAKRLSVGAALGVARHLVGDRRPLVTAYLPLTVWTGTEGQLQWHLNLGQDRDPTSGVWRRWGLASDWTVSDQLGFTAERRFQLGHGLTRVGVRWNLDALTSIDFSGGADAGTRMLGVGFTWEWAR